MCSHIKCVFRRHLASVLAARMYRLCSPRRNQALQCIFVFEDFSQRIFLLRIHSLCSPRRESVVKDPLTCVVKDPLTLLSQAEPSCLPPHRLICLFLIQNVFSYRMCSDIYTIQVFHPTDTFDYCPYRMCSHICVLFRSSTPQTHLHIALSPSSTQLLHNFRRHKCRPGPQGPLETCAAGTSKP